MLQKLKDNLRKDQLEQARKWAELGAKVNYSFFEITDKSTFTKKEVCDALMDLGIDYKKCDGRKWYQFWINDDELRIENAVKKIPL